MPNTSAVGPRPEPKSSAIASEKGPNVYAVPYAVPDAMPAPAATRHARPESMWVGASAAAVVPVTVCSLDDGG